jgi:sialidase-1
MRRTYELATRLSTAVCLLWLGGLLPAAAGEETAIDLTSENASTQWKFTEPTGALKGGELVFDGRKEMSRGFYLPLEWRDVSLQADFLVEPAANGVLACGFVVRAQDAASYYYVHFDRTQAILVRSSVDKSWSEIKRVGGLKKPAGEWHRAKLDCEGETLKVYLNDKLLFQATDKTFSQSGRIGFYANQGIAHLKNISVVGESSPANKAFRIPPKPYVVVCADAGAGAYEAFPDVCRLRDGRLMAAFYAGYGHVSLPNEKWPKGGRISYCTSDDEGVTWSEARTLYDGSDDDRDPSIVQLKDGRLICNYFSLRKSNVPGKQWIGLGTWSVSSDDLGKTWNAPRQIAKEYYCSSPIRELSDGRLILGLYGVKNGTAVGAVVSSDDGAKTWSDPVDIDNGGVRLDAETDVIELKDGTLYAAQRPQMAYSISKDRGMTWSVSKSMGFAGHCPYFHRTVDDVILLAHRVPATSLHYSLDECKTWSKNISVDSVVGAYPSMVNLKDGSVLIVYYEEGAGSSIRARRLRATKEGIEWLTPVGARLE